MPKIKEITTYKYEGQEYDKLLDVKTQVENQLGDIIDGFGDAILHKDKLRVLKVLSDKSTRDKLISLLSVTYEWEDPHNHSFNNKETKNILDL